MMNSQELETAVRMKLHIVVVVLNDSGYGMIKWKQGTAATTTTTAAATTTTTTITTSDPAPPLPAQGTGGFPAYGLDYTNPNFVQYANSYASTRTARSAHTRLLTPRSSIPLTGTAPSATERPAVAAADLPHAARRPPDRPADLVRVAPTRSSSTSTTQADRRRAAPGARVEARRPRRREAERRPPRQRQVADRRQAEAGRAHLGGDGPLATDAPRRRCDQEGVADLRRRRGVGHVQPPGR